VAVESKDSTIRRPALLERLDHALFRRLTTVVAGPGFGKSTVLAAWAETVPSAWYTVTGEDAVLPALARGLVDALATDAGELPGHLAAAVEGADELARAESLAALLSEALEGRPAGELALVLDDVHVLARGSASARLLDALVRQGPPELHVVVSSREEPPFPIERLRGRGQVLDVDAAALAFTEAEVEEVLTSALGEAAPRTARQLHELTAGWPAAVRLAAEALGAAPAEERGQVLDRLRRPEGALFGYLAREVFAPADRGVRALLQRAAHLDRFSAGLCEALGVEDAAEHLHALARRGLFVQPQGGAEGWFGLHAIAREFALESWPLGDDELTELHRAAAAWFDSHGHPEEALRTLTASADHEALAALLKERGPGLLAAGGVEAVLQASAALPAHLRDANVEQLDGHARQIRGDWDGALECYRRAGGAGEELQTGVAWRMGLMHYLRGELDDAVAVFARARPDGSQPGEEALLHAWAATARWVRGDLLEARALADRALNVATSAGDDRALAAAQIVQAMLASREGDQARTHRHALRALEHAQRAGDLLQVIRIRANRGTHLVDEGKFEEALSELDEAVRLAELAGFANFHALALSNRAGTKMRLGRLDEALVDADAARAIYERLGSHAVAYPLMQLGEVYRERGDLAQARAAYEQAIASAERAGDAQGLVPALAGLARVVAPADGEQAGDLARRALDSGSGFALVGAVLAAGWTALSLGDREHASEKAAQAVALASDRRDRAGLAEAIELSVLSEAEPTRSAERLEESISIWHELGSPVRATRAELALARLSGHAGDAERAERRLGALRVRTRPPLAAGLLASLPADDDGAVAVSVLGGFSVARGGRPVSATEWKSRKARDLVKALVARRGHPVAREALMEILWPGEDPALSSNRLSVALATARAVLDPERRFPSDRFIAGGKEAVALELEHVAVDVERFLAQAGAGLALRRDRPRQAFPLLQEAEELYAGDVLEEDEFGWADALRAEARATYVSVARALAEICDETGDHDAAARYRLRILERDPYDEHAHLGLVSTFAAALRPGEARRAYRAYVARLAEIGAEPAPFPAPAALAHP
jgi:ATP/maltotriose-dependent transcriptional regulator MalT/DNA-binding SARP family transcriptional activator